MFLSVFHLAGALVDSTCCDNVVYSNGISVIWYCALHE